MKLLRAGIALLLVCVFFGCSFGTDIDTLREKAGGSKSYTVTFNSNGGSEVPVQTVAKGEMATRPANPALSGYTFDNWYCDAKLTTAYDFSTPVKGNIALYAKWNRVITYTVTFDSNGGSGIAAQTVEMGGTAAFPTNPTQSGYTFDNWYCDADLTAVYDFSTPVMGNIILYAQWNPVPPGSFTVTFNSGGATPVPDQAVTAGDRAAEPEDVTFAGHAFGGWYKEAAFTNQWNFNTDIVTGDIMLYAQWTILQYTVTFNANGGTSAPAGSIVKNYGEKISEPAAMTRTGHTFGGWYKESGFTNQWNFNTDTVTDNITLYAKWTILQYTVTFNAASGTPAPAQQIIDHGNTVTEPAEIARTGYTFGGWYKENTFTNQWNFDTPVTGNIALYAKWTAITYTVIYNANGGTGTMTGSSHTYDIEKALNANAFTLYGSTFDGWMETPNPNGAVKYTNGQSVKNLTATAGETVTLYAKWVDASTVWTVKFETNGGSPIGDAVILRGSKVDRPSDPVRAGYTFDNWYSNSGLTSLWNFDSVVLTDITLYARWYSTVTFDANGATGTVPASQTATAGSSITLPGGSGLSRTGYTFDGWNTSASGTETNHDADSSYTPDGHTTLYAKWYSTVTFNINGATSGTVPAQQTATAGSSITLPSGDGLSRTGYTFDGWNTNTSGTGTNYHDSYTPNGDITLYARWYSTVTFNANGATGGTAPTQQTANAGSSITLPSVGNLTRTDYTFGGWNTNEYGTGTNRNAGSSYTPEGDITLYARWYSTVTFNANGATGGTAPASQTANAGSSITLPAVGNLTRAGYTFGGWNINEYGTGNNHNADSSYTPDGHTTLYAKWYSTVTFNINGGTGTTPSAQTANAGSSITLPAVGNLTRAGYTFGGWNTNSSGTETNYTAGSSYPPTGNITLYARWYSTVTYNINGGTGTTPSAQTANAGSSITLPSGSGLSRTGYTFGGWNTNTSGTETNYNAGAPYTPTGDITLYAKWLPNTAGITLGVKQIIDGAPIIADITISRTGNPVTYTVSVNVSDYDPGSITWQVAGVGAYAGQTVTGSGGSFTLNAAEVKYNSLGGHALILTVTKGGTQYQRAIPFTIVH